MASRTLLVIGIHREELSFGDRVAALVDPQRIDVLRIPSGIPHARTGTDDHFYYNAQHREIYLQLRQQVKGRCRVLIDLHSGLDEGGHCADFFCHDQSFLQSLATAIRQEGKERLVRLVKIIGQEEPVLRQGKSGIVDADARTWIPRKIWDDSSHLYVGLEVYLRTDGDGERDDWTFAWQLIELIDSCAARKLGY